MLKIFWDFFQNQVLGMKWLNKVIGGGLSAAGLNLESKTGASIQFFLYDTIKITVLLCVLIYLISYIQSYFPPERSKRILGRFHGVGANIIAALLGTVTPFCSCSSIPLFIGFTSAGLPLGVTFSFLISSPMVEPWFPRSADEYLRNKNCCHLCSCRFSYRRCRRYHH